MDYDNYKLYLYIDYVPTDMIPCETLEHVDYELNRAVGYNYYLVVGHVGNDKTGYDFPIAQGEIEVNRAYKKTR